MVDQAAEDRMLRHIGLVELGRSLVRTPSFIDEETPLARWIASYLSAQGYRLEIQEVECASDS